jgi:hypothetical protein
MNCDGPTDSSGVPDPRWWPDGRSMTVSLETPAEFIPGRPLGIRLDEIFLLSSFGVLLAAPALVPTPRLHLTQTRAGRAVLDGAWWPRSRDALAELSSVVPALSKMYGRVRSVLLNGPPGPAETADWPSPIT